MAAGVTTLNCWFVTSSLGLAGAATSWPRNLGVARGLRGLWGLRHFVARAGDPELLHPAAQRVGMEIEDPRGARRPFDDAVRFLQHLEDVPPFGFVERRER